jgi:hypothetical protein
VPRATEPTIFVQSVSPAAFFFGLAARDAPFLPQEFDGSAPRTPIPFVASLTIFVQKKARSEKLRRVNPCD